MTKWSGVNGLKKELASLQQSSCVNSIVFWRHFYRVLTPEHVTVQTRKRFWSQAESVWPQAGFGLSTWQTALWQTAERICPMAEMPSAPVLDVFRRPSPLFAGVRHNPAKNWVNSSLRDRGFMGKVSAVRGSKRTRSGAFTSAMVHLLPRATILFYPKNRRSLPTACLMVYLNPFSCKHFTPPHAFRAGHVTNMPTR